MVALGNKCVKTYQITLVYIAFKCYVLFAFINVCIPWYSY